MPKYSRKYNLQQPIHTGHELKFMLTRKESLPESFDLRKTDHVPVILDQGDIGSCVANAVSNSLKFCLNINKLKWKPSRLYIYYFGRIYDGYSVTKDTGMSITGGCASINKFGSCREKLWPYITSKFSIQPSRESIVNAHKHDDNYKFLQINQNIHDIKHALLNGYPVICGIQVYSSFEDIESMTTGKIPMPDTTKEQLYGGHAICLYSYDDKTKRFGVMNSWGTSVGNKGWFTIPYDYITNTKLASDFNQITHYV